MKTTTLIALVVFSAGAFAQTPREIMEREMLKDDIVNGVVRRLKPQPKPDSGLTQEQDAAFSEYAKQKLNAAGPLHPDIGVYMGGRFKGKTPGQATEILRKEFYGNSGGGGLQTGGLGGGGPMEKTAWDSQFAKPPPRPPALPAAVSPSPPVAAAVDTAAVERQESARRAVELYPDAANPTSALTIKVREVYQRLTASNSPILKSPSAPLSVVRMAAAEIGVEPLAK